MARVLLEILPKEIEMGRKYFRTAIAMQTGNPTGKPWEASDEERAYLFDMYAKGELPQQRRTRQIDANRLRRYAKLARKDLVIYGLIDPRDPWRRIRYVGVTNDPQRRLKQHACVHSGNPHLRRWLESLRSVNQRPVMQILEHVIDRVWDVAEREWIARFNSDLNATPGGICKLTPGGWVWKPIKLAEPAQPGKPQPVARTRHSSAPLPGARWSLIMAKANTHAPKWQGSVMPTSRRLAKMKLRDAKSAASVAKMMCAPTYLGGAKTAIATKLKKSNQS